MIALSSRRGIAVMELIVVALIIGVLLAIAIPRFTRPTLDVVEGPGAEIAAGATGTLAVRVTSWRGSAQAGVPVAFEAADGMAVTPTVATTDSSGVARATWFAGPGLGPRTIIAHVEGRETPRVTVETRTGASTGAVAPAPSPSADTPSADTQADTPRSAPADTPAAAVSAPVPRADSGATPR